MFQDGQKVNYFKLEMIKMERIKELQDIINYREYIEAKNNLQKVVDKIVKNHAILGINYRDPWNFEYEIKELDKEFRGY